MKRTRRYYPIVVASLGVLMSLVLCTACASQSSTETSNNEDHQQVTSVETNAETNAEESTKQTVTCKLVVDLSQAKNEGYTGDATLFEEAVEVSLDENGEATAFDIMNAADIKLVAEDSEYGKFISSVEGIGANVYGNSSYWMFQVNGVDAQASADSVTVEDGDTITLYYSVW